MLTWLRRAVLVAALTTLAALAGLYAVERFGLLRHAVEQRLARELGPLAGRVTLEHASLRWFEPALVLDHVTLEPSEPGGTSDLVLERVHIGFSPRLDGLEGVRVDGGRVRLGPRLYDDFNRLAAARREAPPASFRMPPASLSGFALAVELFDGTVFEVGRLDLNAREGRDGAFELAGRLEPAFGGALTAAEPIRVNGTLSTERAQLWAAARDLALESHALPAAARAPMRSFEGGARLTLDSSFELDFAAASRPRATLRASLADGRVVATGALPGVDDVSLELEARLAPPIGATPWSREAWDARAELAVRAGDTRVRAWGELGRRVPGRDWVRAWARAEGVPLARAPLEALGLGRAIGLVFDMLSPTGSLDVAGTVSLAPAAGAWHVNEAAAHVVSRGEVGMAYHGLPIDPGSGVPVPLSGMRGELVLGAQRSRTRPWQLAAYDLVAEHGSGTVSGWTRIAAPERTSGAFPFPELDLALSTPSIAVDATLLDALAQNHHLAWIGPGFAPRGGTVAGGLRLRTGAELGGTSAECDIRVRGSTLRWSQVPVELENVSGDLSVRWAERLSHARGDPLARHRAFGVRYRFDNRGEPRVGAQARVAGWVREESLPPVFDPASLPVPLLQEIRIDIDELGLRGRDFDVLAERFPALGREVSEYGAVGRMRVRHRGARAAPDAPFTSEIEATPLEVHARPQLFQRQTRDVHGRVLVHTQQGGTELGGGGSHLVLTGTWPGGVELYVEGAIPATGEARLEVLGAGIDPTNTSFKGALSTTLANAGAGTQGIDLSGWTLAGAVDFALETRFDASIAEPPRNRYRVHLRDNDLVARELVLADLSGTLEQEEDVLQSAVLRATLGGHPLELHDVIAFPLARLAQVPAADPWLSREGAWKDPNGRALQADIHAQNLPLDAMRRKDIAGAEAAGVAAGALDVLGARLVVTSEADDRGKVAVRGPLRAHDIAFRLGLPVRIDTADVELEELVLESGRVRGWARIAGLQARIAEREVSDAAMIAGYVDGRLTIDNLSGDFEGGQLESLGGAGGGVSKALGIDLSEPYRFDVAMRLTDVEVAGLLQGVFQSSIADEGVLDATLQLSGTPGDVLALTGRGSLSLDEGALWSIPVMRELFLQLGFDRTGVFDRLRSRFELRDGRLQVSHLEIRSSLMDLVGAGWQDLDGELAFDLEVRYGLLNVLGPFSRILYWLNDNIWRVAVRGDFERPEVTIRNFVLEFVRGFEERPPRKLPLPPFSPLGPRF